MERARTQPLNGVVYAIAISGTDVYVGGAFTDAGGDENADYIARWDGSQWHALGTTPMDNTVLVISPTTGGIYAGGLFNNAGGIPEADKIAFWNGAAWQALGGG